jgi:hypothetical protein
VAPTGRISWPPTARKTGDTAPDVGPPPTTHIGHLTRRAPARLALRKIGGRATKAAGQFRAEAREPVGVGELGDDQAADRGALRRVRAAVDGARRSSRILYRRTTDGPCVLVVRGTPWSAVVPSVSHYTIGIAFHTTDRRSDVDELRDEGVLERAGVDPG